MANLLSEGRDGLSSFARTMSPYLEMGAYEALWDQDGATFRRLASRFAEVPGQLPSDFVPAKLAAEYAAMVCRRFDETGVGRFGVRVFGEAEYPTRLRDAAHPVELLYFAGRWELAWETSVAVVGTRNASEAGVARTRKLVKALVAERIHGRIGPGLGHRHGRPRDRDRLRRRDRGGHRHATVGSVSEGERGLAAPDSRGVPARQPSPGGAVRETGFPLEPGVLPGNGTRRCRH